MSNHDPLPTFRSFLTHASALHRAALPADGWAMVMAELAAATPMLDAALVSGLQRAQVCLEGAIAALTGIGDGQERLAKVNAAYHAYHVALMAFYGINVAAPAPVPEYQGIEDCGGLRYAPPSGA